MADPMFAAKAVILMETADGTRLAVRVEHPILILESIVEEPDWLRPDYVLQPPSITVGFDVTLTGFSPGFTIWTPGADPFDETPAITDTKGLTP